jgi:hypothetical protein
LMPDAAGAVVYDSTGLCVPVGHQSRPWTKVDAEIGFDKPG